MSEFFSGASKYRKNIIQIVIDDHINACIITKATVLNSIFMEQRYDTTHPILGSF